MDETKQKLTLKQKLKNTRTELVEAGFTSVKLKVHYIILAFSLAVYLVSRFVPAFGEIWTRYPGTWLRWLFAKITSWFDFSLFEVLVVSLPILLIAVMIRIIAVDGKKHTPKGVYQTVLVLICILCILASMFMLTFGTCYFRNSLATNIGIEQAKVSADELYDATIYVAQNINSLLSDVTYATGGESLMPYSYDELVSKLNQAYASYCEGADYITGYAVNPKPIALSEPFTYTHISGVYSFVTGESNVNVNYPDFVIPYTMAHEMAHQHGIAPEDEANMVAFLVCMESDDVYIKYSGYLNMLTYLSNALYKADKDKYGDFYSSYYGSQLRGEMSSYSAMFAKYQNSTASKVTDTVNSAYLSSQGQKEGTRSYGLVVDLTVAYYKSLGIIK